MSRIFAAILLVVVLAVGGGIIATAAYQAGVNTAVTTGAATGGGTVVAPVVVPAYGYGIGWWHPFGWIFGFFATLFFLFIVFALIRAIFFAAARAARRLGPGLGRLVLRRSERRRDGPGTAQRLGVARARHVRRLASSAHEPGADPDGRRRIPGAGGREPGGCHVAHADPAGRPVRHGLTAAPDRCAPGRLVRGRRRPTQVRPRSRSTMPVHEDHPRRRRRTEDRPARPRLPRARGLRRPDRRRRTRSPGDGPQPPA